MMKSTFESIISLFNNITSFRFTLNIFSSFVIIVITVFLSIFISRVLWKKLPSAYNIAVIGFPRSGKTILITSIFTHIFKEKYLMNKIIIKGQSTIERVNEDIRLIEMGKALGPTTDQERFAYRFDYKIAKLLFPKYYKVEIGDFPGEESERFSEESLNWLHDTPFFKWVMDADAFIFVIDLANVLIEDDSKKYHAKMRSSIRAAWQRLADYYSEGKDSLKNKSTFIVFTKTDLLVRARESHADNKDDINKKILEMGFGENLPPLLYLGMHDELSLQKDINKIAERYKDIIDYIKLQSKEFELIFVSPFLLFNNNGYGIPSLLNKILPK